MAPFGFTRRVKHPYASFSEDHDHITPAVFDHPAYSAVLHPIARGVKKVESALKRANVPVEKLARYDGSHGTKVLVGNFHRAKGLEFKRVYVAGLADGRWPMMYRDLDAEAREEQGRQQVRAAFVALTRARDSLDVVCGGRLPEPIERAREWFDE